MNASVSKTLRFLLAFFVALPLGSFSAFKPDSVRAAALSTVVINEFVSNGNSGEEWVELYNPTGSSVDLSGWEIVDSLDNRFTIDEIASGTSLLAGGYLAIDRDRSGTLGALNNNGDTIKLRNVLDAVIDLVEYGTSSPLQPPSKGQSAGRAPDGDDTLATDLSPTKGTSNLSPTAVSVSAGDGNLANEIVNANQKSVLVEVTIPNVVGATTVTASLSDGVKTVSGIATAAAVGKIMVSGIDSSSLSDGTITVSAKTTVEADESATLIGTSATKTINSALSDPVAVSLPATDKNPANVVNGANRSKAVLEVEVDETAASGDKIVFSVVDSIGNKVEKTVGGRVGKGKVGAELDLSSLADGTLTFSGLISYESGVKSGKVSRTLTKDTVSPTGASLSINNGRTFSSSNRVELTIAVDENSASLMALSNRADFKDANMEPIVKNKNWLFEGSDGEKKVWLKLVDDNRNETLVTDTITVDSENLGLLPPVEKIGQAKDIVFDRVSDTRLEAKIATKGDRSTEFALTVFKKPPIVSPEENVGLKVLVQSYDLTFSDPGALITSPTVRIYYTVDDLIGVGASRDDQIAGIFAYNESAGLWQKFDVSRVISQSDREGYRGYVEAEVDHTSVIAALVDVVPPARPTNLNLTQLSDGSLRLSWERSAGAEKYQVSFRKTSQKTDQAKVDIGNLDSATIIGLEVGTDYIFSVTAVDLGNNVSQESVITVRLPAPGEAPSMIAPIGGPELLPDGEPSGETPVEKPTLTKRKARADDSVGETADQKEAEVTPTPEAKEPVSERSLGPVAVVAIIIVLAFLASRGYDRLLATDQPAEGSRKTQGERQTQDKRKKETPPRW